MGGCFFWGVFFKMQNRLVTFTEKFVQTLQGWEREWELNQWQNLDTLCSEKICSPIISIFIRFTVQIQPVRSSQENPYVMLRQNHQDLEGNDRYEGFCVDMLKELADILKFKYRIRLVGDGLYGVPGANGTWTGMVGELISRVGWCTVYSQRCVSYQSQLIYCRIISLNLWTGRHRLCFFNFLKALHFQLSTCRTDQVT